MINDWIKLNCEKLGISSQVNLIMSEPSFFATPTTRACIGVNLDDLSEVDLHLNKKFFNEKTTFFDAAVVLAHEFRHFWQVLNTKQSGNYKTSDEAADIREYNEQELEVDAWAWAVYIMQQQYGVYPTFDSISPEYTALVMKRAAEIKNEQ